MRIGSAALWRAIAAAILVALPVTAFAAGKSPQDRVLLAAHDAYVAGDGFRLAGYVDRIRGHVLEPYVEFWRLKIRLEDASPDEIRHFLMRNEGAVLAEQLRRDWLLVLGKKGQWDLFRQELPALVRTDPEISGYALQERWRRQDASAPSEIKFLWKSPRPLPEGCLPVVEAMLQSGEITPQELHDRFRLLVRANLIAEARQIAVRLPADRSPSAVQLDVAAGSPARFLEKADGRLKTASEREAAIVALAGLARIDFPRAVGFWNGGLREHFPPEDQQYLWAIFATHAARRHLPEAVDWFIKAGEYPFADEQLVWRARIALRQGNWPDVKTAIERMSQAERDQPAWTYWLGRSLLALGDPEAGRTLFERIAGEHHFYGRLAAEELEMPLKIPTKATAPTRAETAEVSGREGLRRALALYRLGLRTEATAEWLWAVRTMDDRLLLAAAEVARRNKIWDRTISTADRTVGEHDFSLRYPFPYRDLLSRHARRRNLDQHLIFGLVRQESRFTADVRSSAGALGLMQLMPETARLVARKIGMKGFHPSRLTRPEVNAALGSCYLRQLLDGFQENTVLAAAAYNAGPARARKWRDLKPMEGAIYIESIPFTETRRYVKKVMTNALYYGALSGREPRSLKSLLGTIEGGAATNNGTEER